MEGSTGFPQPGESGKGYQPCSEDDVHTVDELGPRASYQRSQSPVDSLDDATISATWQKEEQHRLEDDLAIFQAERLASQDQATLERTYSRSMHRNRSKQPDHVDEFEENTNPVHEHHAQYRTPAHPTTKFAQAYKRVHESSFLIRYFTYIAPLTLLLLIPLLLGRLLYNSASVGGVHLFWFSIWLEILWLTLWAGRILAKCVPYPLGLFASLFTNEDKRWRDMGKQLELPGTLFFWWLGVEISWLPTMNNHILDGYDGDLTWIQTVNKIIVSVFVGVILNFAEKIIIQLIAISFHLRTYADRIETNRFQINSLVKMYQYSREKLTMEDTAFDENAQSGPGSGARTPRVYVEKAQRNVLSGFRKVGDVAGKVAGDFTGRRVVESTHPSQVILVLLNTTSGSQTLARRLHRTFVRPGEENVFEEDISVAFDSNDEAEAAFGMLDRDLNGDISMEELESVCVETGRERKSITASLKDLDSVISKLDGILSFLVAVITILVFISLISTSAAGVLTSAGSSILALSWLFSATAQELLQSIIFVFVKHPFDVGDRISIYGNTGSTLKGDDYFVKEISLLYTEFKKMEGHVVQAPNSYLNTLFILNQRRSGGLAEAVPITIKFGTSLEQIDGLRAKLLDFVKEEKRDYQSNILTEVRDIVEAFSVNVNVIFFYKSNWQNEGLRLQRRNKFICYLMTSMQELGIEGPRQRWAGQKKELPFFLDLGQSRSQLEAMTPSQEPFPVSSRREHEDNAADDRTNPSQIHSALKAPGAKIGGRQRADSVTSVAKKVGFLDVGGVISSNPMGNVHEEHTVHLGPRHRQLANLNRRASIVSHATSRQSTDAQATGFQSEIPLSPIAPRRSDTSRSQEPSTRQARPWRSNSTLRRQVDERYDLMEQGMVAIPEGPGMDRP